MRGKVLEVPQFVPAVHKSSKQFGFSFAYDAPRYGMSCLLTSALPHLFYLFRNLISSPTHPCFIISSY